MTYRFVFYPDPLNTLCVLKSDDGFVGTLSAYTDPASGRAGQSVLVPDSVVTEHGAEFTQSLPGYDTTTFRGLLVLRGDGRALMNIDDYHLKKSAVTPPEPPSGPSDPNADPFAIIRYVYESTLPNLATEAGCGMFTEDCCTELHQKMNRAWGHITKTSGQMQWNGHAIDAIMLLVPSDQTQPGIYDIIKSSLGPDAEPAFNLVDSVNPPLWYYPAAPISASSIHTTNLRLEEEK